MAVCILRKERSWSEWADELRSQLRENKSDSVIVEYLYLYEDLLGFFTYESCS